MKHLEQFQNIAQENGNSRSVENGFNVSAQYIISKLQGTNYAISTQNFIVPVYVENSPPDLVQLNETDGIKVQFLYDKDFTGLPYGGNSSYDISAEVIDIPNFGCSLDDFSGATGKIVLIQDSVLTGPCFTSTASFNAQKSGARAALFWVDGQLSFKLLWLLDIWGVNGTYWKQGDPLIQIPVLSVTSTVRQVLIGSRFSILTKVYFCQSETSSKQYNKVCFHLQCFCGDSRRFERRHHVRVTFRFSGSWSRYNFAFPVCCRRWRSSLTFQELTTMEADLQLYWNWL